MMDTCTRPRYSKTTPSPQELNLLTPGKTLFPNKITLGFRGQDMDRPPSALHAPHVAGSFGATARKRKWSLPLASPGALNGGISVQDQEHFCGSALIWPNCFERE